MGRLAGVQSRSGPVGRRRRLSAEASRRASSRLRRRAALRRQGPPHLPVCAGWLEVIERFGATPCIVIPVRNPLEVAASLKHRDNFLPAKSYLLWLRHVLDAEQATRHLPRAVVAYNDLLGDWRGVVGAVAAKAGLHSARRSDRSELEIDRFVAEALRHHVVNDSQLTARADIVDWVKETYRLLRDFAKKPAAKDKFKRLDRIHAEFDKAWRLVRSRVGRRS